MPHILSISVDDKTLRELDSIKKLGVYSGTSEVFRAGLSALFGELHEAEKLSGRVNAVLLVLHREDAEDHVTKLKHRFDNLVSTQVHQKLEHDYCLEIFVLSGDATRVRDMQKAFRADKKMLMARLVVSG